MFGYVKPYIPDLRVREHEFYRATYCGLCRSMGKHTGCASRLTLSYDFTFLCVVRMALEKTKIETKTFHCKSNPFKRRPLVLDNSALAYCASVAAVLTRAKVQDDVNDSKGMAAFKARLLMGPAGRMVKKALKHDDSLPIEEIESALERLSRLEKERSPSLDSVADCFGDALSAVFAHGLSGREETIAKALGRSIGRCIYVLDAADDMEKDKESASYNPLNISPIPPEALSVAVRLELERAEAAVNLMDFSGVPELSEIIFNIIYEGLPKEADRIFKKECDNNKKGRSKT